MIIGFATENKYTDVGAVYEHMSELSGGNAGDYLKLIDMKQNAKYEIVIADSVQKARELGVMKADAQMLVVFGGESKGGADIVFATSKAHKQHLVDDCGWRKDRVKVVGRPSMDLMWGTDDEKDLLRQVYLRSQYVDRARKTILFSLNNPVISVDMWEEILDWIEGELNVIICCDEVDTDLELKTNVCLPESDDPLTRMLSADMLVTDFHDETLDYLTLERPIVFLGDERPNNWWQIDCGLPGPLVKSAKKIIHAIAHMDEFPQKYIDNRDVWKARLVGGEGNSADRAVEIIMKKWKENAV